MAIKDLPKTFFVDFTILLSQSSFYVRDKAIEVAGPKPSDNSTFAYKTGALAGTLLFRYYNTYIKPYAQNYTSGGVPGGTASYIDANQSTFSKTYKDAATWANEFFVLRTQILGAVGGNSNDPAIKALDIVWLEFSRISGYWTKIAVSDKKKSK